MPVDPVGAAPAEVTGGEGAGTRAIDDDEPVPGAITRRKSGTAPTSCHGLSPDRKQISHCRRCPPGDHLLIGKSLAHARSGSEARRAAAAASSQPSAMGWSPEGTEPGAST